MWMVTTPSEGEDKPEEGRAKTLMAIVEPKAVISRSITSGSYTQI